jgi:hypothetical protein
MGRARFFVPLLLGLSLYVGIERAVFNETVYGRLVSLQGSSGMVRASLRICSRPAEPPAREILVLGDSRIGEGFSVRLADEHLAAKGIVVRSAHVPGSVLRIWYYLIKALDRDATRFAAIVLPTLCYDDADIAEYGGLDPADRVYDLRFCAPALELADLGEFAGSFRSFDDRAKAARTVALRGFAYKHDFEALLVSPFERLRLLKHPIDAFDRSNYEYDGHEGTIRRETGDAEAHAAQKAPEPSPRVAEYRRLWLGRLLDRYAHSPTMICWVRIPRGPFGANAPPGSEHSTLRALAAEGRITLLREDLCVGLERPEYFFDGLHLNREGRRLLSPMLVDAVVEALAARR